MTSNGCSRILPCELANRFLSPSSLPSQLLPLAANSPGPAAAAVAPAADDKVGKSGGGSSMLIAGPGTEEVDTTRAREEERAPPDRLEPGGWRSNGSSGEPTVPATPSAAVTLEGAMASRYSAGVPALCKYTRRREEGWRKEGQRQDSQVAIVPGKQCPRRPKTRLYAAYLRAPAPKFSGVPQQNKTFRRRKIMVRVAEPSWYHGQESLSLAINRLASFFDVPLGVPRGRDGVRIRVALLPRKVKGGTDEEDGDEELHGQTGAVLERQDARDETVLVVVVRVVVAPPGRSRGDDTEDATDDEEGKGGEEEVQRAECRRRSTFGGGDRSALGLADRDEDEDDLDHGQDEEQGLADGAQDAAPGDCRVVRIICPVGGALRGAAVNGEDVGGDESVICARVLFDRSGNWAAKGLTEPGSRVAEAE